MTREEAIQDLKDILEEATSDKDAVCYVTSEDAEALNMAIEALSADAVQGADLINKHDAVTVIRNECWECSNVINNGLCMKILSLPTSAEQREWVVDEYGIYHCPVCYAINNTVYKNYCPNCGAKMTKGE